MAIALSRGTEFYWSTSTAASTAASALVGYVVSFDGPGGGNNMIDVTNLSSTGMEYVPGISDGGQLTLTVNRDLKNAAQNALQADKYAGNLRKCVIKFNDSSTDADKTKAIFDAYCEAFSLSGGVNAPLTASITLRVTGGTTWSTAI